MKSVFAADKIISTSKKTTQDFDGSRWKKNLSVLRDHWKIGSMHWILEAVFREGDCVFVLNKRISPKYQAKSSDSSSQRQTSACFPFCLKFMKRP